jgi:hypothetical protein
VVLVAFDTAIAIGYGIIIASMFYMSVSIDKKHGVLQIFFMMIGMFFTLNELNLLERITRIVGHTTIADFIAQNYGSFLFIVIFVLAYVIVMFLYETFIKTSDSVNV